MAINYHELRNRFKEIKNKKDNGIFLVILFLFVPFSGIAIAGTVIKDQDAINAIIGEAEGEKFIGKVCVAKTILNRGHLKGVYGLKAPRVLKKQYSMKTYQEAERAWNLAKRSYPDKQWTATGWGNAEDIAQFKRAGWFKDCEITNEVGSHYFYRELNR